MPIRAFKHTLDAARKVESWKLDSLSGELANLRDRLNQKVERMNILEVGIKECETKLVSIFTEQPLFWIETREAVLRYLEMLREELLVNAMDADQIASSINTVMGKVVETRRVERLLEKHRDRQVESYLREVRRIEEKIQDDIWLHKISRRHSLG